MQNPRQKRLNYVVRKAAATVLAVTACLLGALTFVAVMLGTVIGAIFITDRSFLSPMLLLPLMIGVPALVIVKIVELCSAQARRARSIPYVPPVQVQVDRLPSEQVLVRATNQPDDHQNLLRGANAQTVTESDELLRTV